MGNGLIDKDFLKEGYNTFMKAPDGIEAIARCFKKELAFECEAQKSALMLEGQRKTFEENRIVEILNAGGGIPNEAALQAERNRGVSYFILTLPLLSTSYALVHWSLEPFQAGWQIMLLNLLTKLLPGRISLIWQTFLTLAAAVFAVTAVVYLSLVRNELAAVYLLQGTPGFDQAVADFYQKSLHLLRMVFPLLTLALDLMAGVTLHTALTKLASSGPNLKLLKRLESIRGDMVRMGGRIKELEVLPEKAANGFWRGVEIARAETTKKEKFEEVRLRPAPSPEEIANRKAIHISIALVAFILILISLILAVKAFAGEVVVVGLDISASNNVADYRNTSEFPKNLNGIEKVIQQARPGTEIKVYAITEESFGKIYVLCDGKISEENPGFFGQNLRRDMNSLLTDWRKVAEKLQATGKATDVFGFFFLAEGLLAGQKTDKKTLILFSDMRHNRWVDLERREVIDVGLLDQVKRVYGVPNLLGVKIYVYGAHGNGKSLVYWNSLRKFWETFFKEAKGELKIYSPLREVRYE
ncbi:MAG: hypothetical protein NTY64_21505 [Deltaproteobacteria bacterium]|nr:hypothetical protein [Deltaproteobacteria bacterium]